jgi:hypothetical protein
MKFRIVFITGVFIMLFTSTSIGNDKKTIVQRIEENDSIPVYIVCKDIDYNKYDCAKAGIILSPKEIRANETPHINMRAPDAYDSLIYHFIGELNKNFNTDKFVISSNKNLPKITKNLMDVEDPKAELIVIIKVDATYSYDYMTKPSRNDIAELITTMELNGGFTFDFYLINKEEQADRRLSGDGGFVYGKGFNVTGFPKDATYLARLSNPLLLMDKFINVGTERITKYAQRQYKKDTKKRAKAK